MDKYYVGCIWRLVEHSCAPRLKDAIWGVGIDSGFVLERSHNIRDKLIEALSRKRSDMIAPMFRAMFDLPACKAMILSGFDAPAMLACAVIGGFGFARKMERKFLLRRLVALATGTGARRREALACHVAGLHKLKPCTASVASMGVVWVWCRRGGGAVLVKAIEWFPG